MYFAGLCLYGVANGLKITGYNLGPITVLGSIFSSTLVFNLLFARFMLKETITRPKIASSLAIVAGAILCTIGAPFAGDVKTVFSPDDISLLLETHVPFIVVCSVALLLSLGFFVYFERAYPVVREDDAAKAAAEGVDVVAGKGLAPPSQRTPPRWLDSLMALVYPGSLGLDEALADLLIRAWTAMLGVCAGGRACADCNTPVVYVSIGLWVLLSFGGSLVLMPIIYRRYEVSTALPIEYGAVNAGTVMVGLLFYDEHQFMRPWQVALQILGCVVILAGLGIGRIEAPAAATARREEVSSASAGL